MTTAILNRLFGANPTLGNITELISELTGQDKDAVVARMMDSVPLDETQAKSLIVDFFSPGAGAPVATPIEAIATQPTAISTSTTEIEGKRRRGRPKSSSTSATGGKTVAQEDLNGSKTGAAKKGEGKSQKLTLAQKRDRLKENNLPSGIGKFKDELALGTGTAENLKAMFRIWWSKICKAQAKGELYERVLTLIADKTEFGAWYVLDIAAPYADDSSQYRKVIEKLPKVARTLLEGLGLGNTQPEAEEKAPLEEGFSFDQSTIGQERELVETGA